MLREMTVNFLGVTLVLFAILFINQVGTVLARAAQLQYQSGFVLELIGLGAAQNFALLSADQVSLLGALCLPSDGSITTAKWPPRRPAASEWSGWRPRFGCWRCPSLP